MSDRHDRLQDARTGERVVVRHLIEGGARATDVIGELAALDAATVTVIRDGRRHVIPLSTVVAAKPIPSTPSAWRVGRFLRRARVAVLDLDGVVRRFNETGWQGVHERALGLPADGLIDLAFSLPEARAMVIGRGTYAAWTTALRTHLCELGHDPVLIEALLRDWADDLGTPIGPTVDLMDDLVAAGTPVFIFTNGTDRVPHELEQIGLGRFVPNLINAHVIGWAKPSLEAYAAAHAHIEARLGRRVGTAEVHFTDDRPGNVDAARVFGWQARVFTPPTSP